MIGGRDTVSVLGIPIDRLSWGEAVDRISTWADRRESRAVSICNAHSLVTAKHDNSLCSALHLSDMATADGAPVALMVRWMGGKSQPRVNGPDLMWASCERASLCGHSIFLYGSTPRTLEQLSERLRIEFPKLRIAGMISPPFRDVSDLEDEAIVEQINSSGAGIVWVGLGCPKQEVWMARHRHRIEAVMVGVGAAFDYHAGTVRRAPLWMQRYGFEWLYRLLQEPRRLWRRYLVTNSLFLAYGAWQLICRSLRVTS